jgi:hypothetical protein
LEKYVSCVKKYFRNIGPPYIRWFFIPFLLIKSGFFDTAKKTLCQAKKKVKKFYFAFSVIFCLCFCYQTCIGILFVVFEKFFSARKNIFFLKSNLDIYINVQK